MFSLIGTGGRGYLMLTAVWRATDSALEGLRQEVAARAEIEDPATIELVPAPVRVARCDLLLGDGSGDFQVLATSTTSGMPPYSALFSATLAGDQFTNAAAAINGRGGFLAVEYNAGLPKQVRATARLAPLSALFVPWLRDVTANDQAAFRSAIEGAVEDGLAAITVSLPENPSPQLVARLYDRLLEHATSVLPRMLEGWDGGGIGELEVVVELVEESVEPLRPRADLATLVYDPAHIIVAAGGTPGSEGAKAPGDRLRVRLGFDPAGSPLAWVKVRSGHSQAVLKPPHFAPADIDVDRRSGPLVVTAGFSNGASMHSMEVGIPGGRELLLTAEQLGLRRLAVDAGPLAVAGLQSAEISLRYRPPHRPDEQRSTIRFHEGAWASQWWVVTDTASWLRYLDYNWKATTQDGRAVGESVAPASSPKIILSLPGGNTNAAN